MTVDGESAWRAAWTWASEWRGTASFWLTEALAAIAGGYVIYLVDDDWASAVVGFVVGPVVAFLLAYLWRWRSIKKQSALRSVVISVVEEVMSPGNSGEARREEVRRLFDDYYTSQLAKLQRGLEELKADPDGFYWKEFADLAWRTVTGLSVFSGKIGEYLTLTLEEENRQVDRSSHDPTVKLRAAWTFVESMGEARQLFVPE